MTNAQKLESGEKYKDCLPYDTSLFSGASGFPVFDMNGHIVALHTHPAGIRRRYDVEIWLKTGRQRRQRDINVILMSLCERWFNIIQTLKQRRYNVRRNFDVVSASV